MQIGIFGGSFDPPHLGHLRSAQRLLGHKSVDQAWLMPCYSHVWEKKLSPVKHRLAMTKLLENKNIKVSTIEIEQKRPVPTIETLRILRKKYPNDRFFWVIGEKSLPELPKWKDYEKLISNNDLLVVAEIKGISSSIIRQRVKKNLSLKGFVSKKVAEYIKNNGLYKNC